MTQKIPNALIGIAGVHYVAYQLSLRGLIALPTIRNAQGYDIVVTAPDGLKHANIQVKASQKRVNFWPMPPAKKIRAGPHDYYVLLRWLKDKDGFEGFMLSGRQARTEVEDTEKRQSERKRVGSRRVSFPCVYIRPKTAAKWRKVWETWKL